MILADFGVGKWPNLADAILQKKWFVNAFFSDNHCPRAVDEASLSYEIHMNQPL